MYPHLYLIVLCDVQEIQENINALLESEGMYVYYICVYIRICTSI